MRSVLLATLTLLLAATPAHAAVTITVKVTPAETQYGKRTRVTGTVIDNGAPFARQPVQLQAKRYPFEAPFAPLGMTTTNAEGAFSFERTLNRNHRFRVVAAGVTSKRVRAYVFPATKLTFRARSSRVIRLTQRYRVPRGVRLEQPTIFYVGPRGRKTAPRVATGELKRIRAGRYRSTAIVRIPAAWDGFFRYASCFRYTGGSGMGNPRASCPRRYRF